MPEKHDFFQRNEKQGMSCFTKCAPVASFLILAAADWLSKRCAMLTLPYPPKGEPCFLSLALHKNPGISFSLLGESQWLSLACSAAAAAGLAVLYAKNRKTALSPGALLMLAGAVCNLTDRIVLGFVVDWIRIFFYINLADLYICFGALLFLKESLRETEHIRQKGKKC